MNYTTDLFEAIITLVLNYKENAINAIKDGDTVLYIPAGFDYPTFINLCANPFGLQAGNKNQTEPIYVSLEEALMGRNADGSHHVGFLVLDPIDREIVAILDKDGEELSDNIDPNGEAINGTWCGYEISLKDKTGRNYRLTTTTRVRGMTKVKVIKNNDKFSAFINENPIELDPDLPIAQSHFL